MQEYVSDFIGLPLLTRGGEKIGYIRNVQTDKNLKRVRNLECCDEEEEEFVLPVSAVESFGKDAAVVKTPSAKGCKNCLPAPFGCAVFSKDGAQLGAAADFGRRGSEITELVLSDGTAISADRIVSVTDAVMIDLSENFVPKPVTRTRVKKRGAEGMRAENGESPREETPAPQKAPLSAQTAATEREERSAAEEAESETATARETISANGTAEGGAAQYRPDAPRRTVKRAGSGLLTGKILPKNLYDARGRTIAREGTAVTAETIRRAMQHNKLFELTLLCCGSAPLWR